MTTHIYKVVNPLGGGGGSVDGPVSSTDNAVVRFDGTDGTQIQNSGVTISDTNDVTVPGEVTVNGTAVKSTLDNHETRIDNLEVATYSQLFNSTTDWGAPSGGFYTITVSVGTHGKGSTPNVQIQSLSGSDYIEVEVDEIKVTSAGNVSFKVPSSLDSRFEGRILID